MTTWSQPTHTTRRNKKAAKLAAKYTWAATKWTIKTGWKHRVLLAPAYATASTYGIAGLEHAIGGSGTIVAATSGIAGLALHKWRGLPTPQRLRDHTQHDRVLDITSWGFLAATTGLGIATANSGVGVPMPGLWAITAVAATATWGIIRATKPQDTTTTTPSDDIRKAWRTRIAAKQGAIPGATLGRIIRVDSTTLTPPGHLGPVVDRAGWTAYAELPEIGATATSTITAITTAKLAAAYRTSALNVLLGRDDAKTEHRVKVTVMTKNPSTDVIAYDPDTWQVTADGCVPIAVSPDGTIPQYRVWKPKSGPAHAMVSGNSGSGKSKGAQLLITQSVATGRVVPIIADPQGGASLPAWAGDSGVAPVTARDPEEIEDLFAALADVATERGKFLASLGLGDWDVDTMHRDHGRPMYMVVLDEAHMVLAGNVGMTQRVSTAAKIWRKLGMQIVLITQTPNLSEIGGEQSIRQNIVGGNVISFRTNSRSAGGMLLPSAAPDPYDIPPIIGTKTTEGMCVMSTSGPFGTPTNAVRVPYLDADTAASEALRLARDVMPDLDDTAAAILKVDVSAWRGRLDQIADGVSVSKEDSPLTEGKYASISERICDYLQSQPAGSTIETGTIYTALSINPSTTSTTLQRLAEKNKVVKHGHGLWSAQL